MKDVEALIVPPKQHYRVYLFKLDIDEFGIPIKLECSIDKYLLYYILLFDEVLLQTSAILKRHDLFNHFLQHEDLYIGTINGHHIIFPYKGKHDFSSSQFFKEYLEGRYQAIGNNAQNGEINAYEINGAKKIAEVLDKYVNNKMTIAKYDTDFLFRQKVIESGKQFLSQFDSSNKTYDLFSGFAREEYLFQTFSLLQKAEKTRYLTEKNMNELGLWLRGIYFDANASATQCFTNNDFHVNFYYVESFIKMIGLETLINKASNINFEMIKHIKKWNCFAYLQNIYFVNSKLALDKLFDLYRRSSYRKPFYETIEFYDLCSSCKINPTLFITSIDSLRKMLHDLLKQRK